MIKYSRHRVGACGIFWLMVICVRVSGCVCNECPDAPESMGAKQMIGQKSEHAKTLTTLADCQLQHPVHFFIGVICREAQLVKTGKQRQK